MPLSNSSFNLNIFLLKHFKIILIQNHTKFILSFIKEDKWLKIITN